MRAPGRCQGEAPITQIEEAARRLCAIDLRERGIEETRIPELVERFWPVLHNEIREGIVDDRWNMSRAHIEELAAEYQRLLSR